MAEGQFPKILLESMKKWLAERTDQWTKNVEELGAGLTSSDPEKVMNAALTFGPGAIKTFQGSPWKFRRVNDDKVGTGEGTQFEGWGHYSSDHPRVAEGYADMFGRGAVVDRRGQPLATEPMYGDQGLRDARKILNNTSFDMPAGASLRDLYAQAETNAKNLRYDSLDSLLKHLRDWEAKGGRPAHAGRVYEMELRWPSRVQEKVDPLSPKHFLQREAPIGTQPEIHQKINQSGLFGGGITGDATGKEVYNELARVMGGPRQASQALFTEGVPGIRYADPDFGITHGKGGERAQNYVTFSDMLMDIMRRRRFGYD